MFSALRQNSVFYILNKKGTPSLKKGNVISVTAPKPRNTGYYNHNFDMVVDLVATVDGQTVNYNMLPANLDVADSYSNGDAIVIADSKEAMNAEILSLKQKSTDILNSIDYHQEFVNQCESLLSALNPEYAERQAQQEEINSLKSQVNDLLESVNSLMSANQKLIAELTNDNQNENVGN